MASPARSSEFAYLSEVRLNGFKSYVGSSFALKPLTVMVGSNASGKSNALDALSLLALLAEERSVSDLERGDEDVAGIRGGLKSAAPFGSNLVAVGCTVVYRNVRYELSVDFDVQGEPEIVNELLVVREPGSKPRTLLHARRSEPGSGIAEVETYSGRMPKVFRFLSSRLASAQATTKVPVDSAAREQVVFACNVVLSVLRNIFVLDPIPGQMRIYSRIGALPNRHGTSTSALIWELRRDPGAWEQVNALLEGLVGSRLVQVDFVEAAYRGQSRAVDVMVALRENFHHSVQLVPADLMSDGTLRYLAITATLLTLGRPKSESGLDPVPATRTLVVEEIENGLYPTQAAAVLEVLKRQARGSGVNLLVTTHSPALLDAMTAEDHDGVYVCRRNVRGESELTRLVDHSNYVSIAASGRVGLSMTLGKFEVEPAPMSFAELLADIQ